MTRARSWAAVVLVGAVMSTAHALTVDDALKQSPQERLSYVIGVFDGWAIEPVHTACQDSVPALELVQAGLSYLELIEAEPPNSTLGRMRRVPAALALSLRFSQVCQWRQKR